MQQAKQNDTHRRAVYMRRYWGVRCATFHPDCVACAAWRAFDATGRLSAGTLEAIAETEDACRPGGLARLFDALGMTAASEARVERAVQSYRDGRSQP